MANASNLTCPAPGRWGQCGRPVHVKKYGLCHGHYTQRRRGSDLAPLRGDYAADTPCEFDGCDRNARRNGYCNAHHFQMKAGTPLRPLRKYRPQGTASHRDELGRKNCPRCHQDKIPTEYYTAAHTVDGLSAICIRCDRSAKLLRKFRITLAEYELLLAKQGGKCAICSTVECPTGKQFAVDHDHRCCPGAKTCGKCIRGLLCNNCNYILGLLHDDTHHARRVIQYLERGR